MNIGNKRKEMQQDGNKPKRVKKECDYGERCYRRNPAHFREFSHCHLEAILDTYSGSGPYTIPDKYSMDRVTIEEQLDVMVEKQLYTPWVKGDSCTANVASNNCGDGMDLDTSNSSSNIANQGPKPQEKPAAQKRNNSPTGVPSSSQKGVQNSQSTQKPLSPKVPKDINSIKESPNRSQTSVAQSTCEGSSNTSQGGQKTSQGGQTTSQGVNKPANAEGSRSCYAATGTSRKLNDSDYRPIVPPTRRVQDFLTVVVPKGKMAAKHAASAPYHMFYTTITAARDTHNQPYSITFQEILDHSLGELKCSLQINFMVELGWLLAQYYFAGYSAKRLTILYGEDSPDLQTISQKKPHVDAHMVKMSSPFGKHHTKLMLLCYEDGSVRVLVSTANLYIDDWENRVQGLWFSPRCPELPPDAMPYDGESPTMFKRTLLRYLAHYQSPALAGYIERVKRCDFSHINVFFVASVPGSHFDTDWGMTRVGSLLRQHCAIPASESKQWPVLAQASSIGSYGKEPNLWLTGDFLHHFTKIRDQPQTLSSPAAIKIIYPSLENVQGSHDGLLGGGCLPYAASAHIKQPWLNNFLYQWRATSTKRDRAMPHIKSYTRTSPDNMKAAYFLLTSGNISKAAWGSINKGNAALRIMSYEAGVLFLPRYIINEDFFPLQEQERNRLVLPYDVPPVKYTKEMSPWVSDYLMG